MAAVTYSIAQPGDDYLLDASLSNKARGLLALLVTLHTRGKLDGKARKDVESCTRDGREAVNSAWHELQRAGYIECVLMHSQDCPRCFHYKLLPGRAAMEAGA